MFAAHVKLGSEQRHAILLVATLGGGTSGALVCLAELGHAHPGAATVYLLVLFTLHALGIAAGLSLHRHARNWMRLTALYLVVQIPVVQSVAFSYTLWSVAAYAFSFYPTSGAFETSWLIGIRSELTVLGSPREFGIGINIVPIALLMLLSSKPSGSLDRPA